MSEKVLLIALDIDGTLTTRRGIIHPDNAAAVRDAQRAGVIVSIASGRSPGNIFLMLREAGLVCPLITVNGAQCTDEALNTFALHPMAPGTAAAVSDLLFSRGVRFFMMGDGFVCTSDETMRHHSELQFGERLTELGHRFFRGPAVLEKLARTENILKFFVPETPGLDRIRSALKALPGIDVTRSGPNNIEILPHGVDKAVGIRDMAGKYGIPAENVMAVGDEENDIPMLDAAGWPVAMGNAAEEVKRHARFVTLTNDEAGVAAAIRRLVL